jgi:hypothetical protein
MSYHKIHVRGRKNLFKGKQCLLDGLLFIVFHPLIQMNKNDISATLISEDVTKCLVQAVQSAASGKKNDALACVIWVILSMTAIGM